MNKTNQEDRTSGMETWNRLTAPRGEGGGRRGCKEGGGTSQRTCLNDPWTWTTVWRLTVGAGVGAGWRRAKGDKLGQLS